MKIMVLSDKKEIYNELLEEARKLGSEVSAYLAGNPDEASTIGADRVYFTEMAPDRMFEDYADTLKQAISQEHPQVILISATKRGKYMAGRIAAHLGTSALTDLNAIEVSGDGIKGCQMYYGGLASRELKSTGTAVITVGASAFEPSTAAPAGQIIPVPYVEPGSKIVRKRLIPKEGETINLTAAKKVIGIGRGIKAKEDLALIEEFAKAIGAETGCSRPIAEGEGWMGTDRYIGVSGIMLKPDVYIAVGISGQIQHTIGINSSRVIIAINKDKNAPIFKACDYGIVGDLYKIIPALTAMI